MASPTSWGGNYSPGRLRLGRYGSSSRVPSSTNNSAFNFSSRTWEGGTFMPPPLDMESSSKVVSGKSIPFPRRLLAMIRKESTTRPHVVRWSTDGHAFFVDDEDSFVREILPRYGFKASKMQSFQRNLNIYGFTRLSKGPYASGYAHPEFGRDIQDEQLDWIARDSGKNKSGEKHKRKHHGGDEDDGYRSERSGYGSSTGGGGGFCDTPGSAHHPSSQQHPLRVKGGGSPARGALCRVDHLGGFLSGLVDGHADEAASRENLLEFGLNGSKGFRRATFKACRWRHSGLAGAAAAAAAPTPAAAVAAMAVEAAAKRRCLATPDSWLDPLPPRRPHLLKASRFWALPHAAHEEGDDDDDYEEGHLSTRAPFRSMTSTVQAPLDTSERCFDRLFVKRCVRVH